MNCRSRILNLSLLNQDNERPRFTNKLATAIRQNRAKRSPVVGKSTWPGMMTVIPFILIVVLRRKMQDPRIRKVRGPSCYFVTFWWNNIHNTKCASSDFVHPFGIKLKNSLLKGLLITAFFTQKKIFITLNCTYHSGCHVGMAVFGFEIRLSCYSFMYI